MGVSQYTLININREAKRTNSEHLFETPGMFKLSSLEYKGNCTEELYTSIIKNKGYPQK